MRVMKIPLTIRLPENLFHIVQEIAEKEKRSLSSQMELMAEEYIYSQEKYKEIIAKYKKDK
jgi:hypothetical protein